MHQDEQRLMSMLMWFIFEAAAGLLHLQEMGFELPR
jgi:hypothetical protein